MEKSTSKSVIDNLKHVTLSVRAGSTAHEFDIIDQPQTFSFIVGLGTDGLTPFEYALTGKTSGDTVRLQLRPKELNRIFKHINPPFLHKFTDHAETFFTAVILSVKTAESRDVVRTMAEMAECGSGCECGCGCKDDDAGSFPGHGH